MTKMNIAICYSGQIRNFQECFPTHLENIINTNKHHSFYIFGHFWHNTDLDGKPFFNGYEKRGRINKEDACSFLNINPSSVIFDKPVNFKSNIQPDHRFPHPVDRTLSMFMSIAMANLLKNTFSTIRNISFDLNIRIRTDLFFHKPIDMSNFDLDLCHVNDQYIHTDYAVNDLFAIANNKNMDKYCSVYDNIPNLIQDGCAVNPECFLGYNLKKNMIKIQKHKFQRNIFNLYRDIR